jgi:hypothetical protein
MGCDYYILKLLRIYYNDVEYLEIEINRKNGYYDNIQFDEDANDYEEKLDEHIKEVLKPTIDPIVIYSNNNFNKSSCKSKYESLVNNEINKHNVTWNAIKKIIKVEERRER